MDGNTTEDRRWLVLGGKLLTKERKEGKEKVEGKEV
jgi:hypothetical protein